MDMVRHLLYIFHGIATIKIFAYISSDIVLEAELATRMIIHEDRDIDYHIVENDKLLATVYALFEFLHGVVFQFLIVDVEWWLVKHSIPVEKFWHEE